MRIAGPVLVATDFGDGADEALRQGGILARSHGVGLTLCHVLPDEVPGLLTRHASDALAERAAAVLSRDAPAPELLVVTGSPHGGLLDQAQRMGAGVLVLGAQSNTLAGKPLGRVAEHVVRHAPCAVLVARPSSPGKVLGATDFSDPALPAVQAAVGEATRRGVAVVIIHCMDLLPPLAIVGHEVPTLGVEVITAMRDHWEHRLRESLDRFGAEGEFLLKEGAAGTLIVETAVTLPAELVVVGTHGRTGWKRLVLGSVAEAVVRTAPCSVLVVRLGVR